MRSRFPWRAPMVLAVVVILALVSACTPSPGGETFTENDDDAASSIEVATGLGFLADHEVHQAEFAGGADGSLYVVWREPGGSRGSDLWLARHAAGSAFEPPVRINDIPETVASVDLDESRAAVSVGADGLIAVAWSTPDADIRAAISRDGGASFEPSVILNADENPDSYRGFVDIALDGAGVAHAAWIDARFARRGAEEPADLYYARIEGGVATEVNLTEKQIPSICGCCRVDIDARDDDRLVIAFRNTGGGYRDVFRVSAGADGVFGQPQRLGPPMWRLRGCPVIGPLNVGEVTLWVEASTGKRRLLAATATDESYEVVAEDEEGWAMERPPRLVVGAPAGQPLLLLPGRPSGRILGGHGTQWSVVAADVPRWAMSAAFIGTRLVLLGDVDGEAVAESRASNP